MEKPLQPSDIVVLLHTHAFDLLAQVEAATRCVREIHHHVGILRDDADETARGDALHVIRDDASRLLSDNDGFCSTLREVQALAGQLTPERRRTVQFVMWDRRRHA